jgi:hypothetical protein
VKIRFYRVIRVQSLFGSGFARLEIDEKIYPEPCIHQAYCSDRLSLVCHGISTLPGIFLFFLERFNLCDDASKGLPDQLPELVSLY